MVEVLYWFLIFICCSLGFVFANLFLFFVIYGIVLALNLFYRIFTGKNLKLYEKFSSCFESEDYFIPFLFSIVCVIWFIKKVIIDEPQDDWDLVVQKEPIKPKNVVKTEPSKSWDDLSKEFSENLRKIEQERLKNDYPVKLAQKIDKTYEELLSRKEWYNFRNKVINDRGYICEFCKKKHNLQIHHKLYYKKPNKEKIEPWLYNMEEVLLLCDNCHKSVHKKNKIKVYYISYADYNNRKVGFYNQN